jgi:hypothetical protein
MGESPGNPSLFTALGWVAQYHYDAVESLRRYFNPDSMGSPARFDGSHAVRLDARPVDYFEETGLRSSLAILTWIEAVFQLDYQYRSRRNGPKDSLSKAFRAIRKSGKRITRLDPELFDAWTKHTLGVNALIGDLRNAFKYRNWLAHGRYWTPKLGRDYDFEYLYRLAETVYRNLPLCDLDEASGG